MCTVRIRELLLPSSTDERLQKLHQNPLDNFKDLSIHTPTNPHWARVVDYGPFSLRVIHKEGLRPSSGVNNGLMMKHT
jgi:hypothetical protein